MLDRTLGLGVSARRATQMFGGMIAALVTTLALAAPPLDSAVLPNATATTTPATPPSAEATPAYTFPIPEALHPLDVHPRTSLSIVEQLRHNHYLQKPLDDAASSELFDKYIDLLDSGHAYFLASDIQALEKYRYALDDALKRGDLDPAFDIFNRYQVRLEERLEFLITELGQGLQTMNFNTNETIEVERKHAPWAATTAELDDLWRKRLKAAVLGMKLNGKQIAEIQDVLTKRYKNRLKQATQTNSEDAFQVYVNAYASTYDPHTQYFSPRTSENFNINMSLSLEGIGAVLRTRRRLHRGRASRSGGPGRQSRRAEAVGSHHRRRPGRKRQADRRGRLASRRRGRTDPRSQGVGRSARDHSCRAPKTASRGSSASRATRCSSRNSRRRRSC